jgi:hypothetical protein
MRDRRTLFVAAIFLAAVAVSAARLLMHLTGGVGEVQLAWAQISSCGDGFVEPPEQCDPPGSITCPPGSPAAAFLPCNQDCTCPTIPSTTTSSPTTTTPPTTTTSTTTATPSTTTTTTLPDHFQCYEVKPKAFAAVSGVSVQDQFGEHTETVRFPHRLCAPADKKDEFPDAPMHPEHLIGHLVSGPAVKVLHQTVVNQFGTIVLDVVRPDILLVPTLKTLALPGPSALTQPTVDHFQCYKVKPSPGAPKFQKILGVKVDDQFGTATLDLLKPARLCAPANKRNEDPTAPDHPGHLLCYKTKNSAFGTVQTYTNSQFGPAQPLVIHRRELCVPSLKNPSVTTTSSTTTSSTTTTSMSTSSSSTSTSTSSSSTSSSTTSSTIIPTCDLSRCRLCQMICRRDEQLCLQTCLTDNFNCRAACTIPGATDDVPACQAACDATLTVCEAGCNDCEAECSTSNNCEPDCGCPSGLEACSSGCSDTSTDRFNCGACGAVCVGSRSVCTNSMCSCTPDCTGRECGDDGCGGSCGSCDMSVCDSVDGTCKACIPNGHVFCSKSSDCCSGFCFLGGSCAPPPTG